MNEQKNTKWENYIVFNNFLIFQDINNIITDNSNLLLCIIY